MPPETLSEKVRKGYESMIDDPKTPAHLRLGALNALQKHLALEGGGTIEPPSDSQAPDPMADLDRLEVQRRKRARR